MDWEQFLKQNESTLSIDEWGLSRNKFQAKDRVYNMKGPIDTLKTLLEDHSEYPENTIEIDQKDPGTSFRIWTKHRIYFSEVDDNYDMQVHCAFRYPPYTVVN